MSLVIEKFLICDKGYPRKHGCDSFGVDGSRRVNLKQLRIDAKRNGWIVRKGEDICPDCQLTPTSK